MTLRKIMEKADDLESLLESVPVLEYGNLSYGPIISSGDVGLALSRYDFIYRLDICEGTSLDFGIVDGSILYQLLKAAIDSEQGLNPGSRVSAAELIDEAVGEVSNVRQYISRLRKRLGKDAILSEGHHSDAGYVLDLSKILRLKPSVRVSSAKRQRIVDVLKDSENVFMPYNAISDKLGVSELTARDMIRASGFKASYSANYFPQHEGGYVILAKGRGMIYFDPEADHPRKYGLGEGLAYWPKLGILFDMDDIAIFTPDQRRVFNMLFRRAWRGNQHYIDSNEIAERVISASVSDPARSVYNLVGGIRKTIGPYAERIELEGSVLGYRLILPGSS